MMGLFRSDRAADATAEITRLSRRETTLRGELARAHHALDEATTARREALVSADDDESIDDIVSDEVRTLTDRVAALQEALAELTRRRGLAECKLADIQDRARREELAAGLAEVHGEIIEALTGHERTGRTLFDALRRISAGELAATQLAQFDRMLAEQIGEMLREVAARRTALLEGSIPTAAIGIIEAPPAIPASTAADTEGVAA